MQAWNSHAQGVTRLMEARGPDSWDSPLAQMILKIMRHAVVQSAVIWFSLPMLTVDHR